MDEVLNRIHRGDCIEGMNALPAGSVDLAFADPPFNIGYDYDVYQDQLESDQYLAWSRDWISAVYRVLRPTGTFWLAIGDEYAAELKVESRKIGFRCRSWVVWYYTFGVNCSRKFSRSHAHLFYFVKDPANFTFRENDLANRIPSARQLVYNDRRANPAGRLPDDTWVIPPAQTAGELTDESNVWDPRELPAPSDSQQTWTLRPQDLEECFSAEEDTWYFPRVAGTFKERAGFHGCQMPEQLLGRIIRTCSNEGDVVLDPFSGSATTLAVAKKLGRRFLGFEISQEYVERGQTRLAAVKVGDQLEGSAEPLLSAPKTGAGRGVAIESRKPGRRGDKSENRDGAAVFQQPHDQKSLTEWGVMEAFRLAHRGFSIDRVVADPELNRAFVEACRNLGLFGDARCWNVLLFRLRKSGRLQQFAATEYTEISWTDCDRYLFASEIALQQMLSAPRAESLDEILCDPELAAEFDSLAAKYAPGSSPLEYRWAALKLRKQAKLARSRASILDDRRLRFSRMVPLEEFDPALLAPTPGVYVLGRDRTKLYVGETLNLSERLSFQFGGPNRELWTAMSERLCIQTLSTDISPGEMLAWQSYWVRRYKPVLNFQELGSAD